MKLKRFKERDNKRMGIILFTIACIFLVSGVILYRTFAIFEVKTNQNVIKGKVGNTGDLEFAFLKEDQLVKNAPPQNENYGFNPIKSYCTNDAKVDWDNDKWSALVSNINETKTKCYLYFEKNETGMFRDVTETTNDKMYQYKTQISKIVFQTKIEKIDNEFAHFDESVSQDQSLISRIVPDGNDNYVLYIQANGKIKANSNNSGYLFSGFSNVVTIEGIENFDTSLATNLYALFGSMSSLQTIDVSHFNTSKVTTFGDIFNGCTSLTTITGINNWDTSSATSMTSIFAITAITSLDLSNWKTGKVTNMNYLFSGTTQLAELKGIAEWDTSSLTSILHAFANTNLETLNLSGWDTSKITSMRYAFQNSQKLNKIIYGPNFQKNSNADTTGMFNNCPANHPEHVSWNEVTNWN